MKKFLLLLLLFPYLSCKNQNATADKDNKIQSQEKKIKALEDRLNKMGESPREDKKEYYSIGSSEDDVIKIQGQPESIIGGEYQKSFIYGRDMVSFEKGKVVNYINVDGTLKIHVKLTSSKKTSTNTIPAKPIGITKYVYYTCYLKEFGELTKYTSKIYKIENFTTDKMFEIGDCLAQQVKYFKQTREKVIALPSEFDAYSLASSDWNNQAGGIMPGSDFCNK